MPRRNDIKKILVIGSGPIVIGQACEFDYSGTQACRVLKSEGYEVVLINSNPATIMTDPIMADRTYIEPITPEFVAAVITEERPDALLPTLGGQTALNTAVAVWEMGTQESYKAGVAGLDMKKFRSAFKRMKFIGAEIGAIKKGEDRELFKKTMKEIGLDLPKSAQVNNLADALRTARRIGFPVIIRPCFTLGGTGGGVAYNVEELRHLAKLGLDASPSNEILVEESVVGWKEFELEVMRDKKDNVVIICSIENFDPMGVHTGDSITVAPVQTLTDKEYQIMRDASIRCIRAVGVETGGSNIQFALNPDNGRMVIIEMNPRVSRSSALASKATGFPIAKIAAKLAVGYTLDEIPNDITRQTPACFEPTIDYCVVKIPRFAFEKFAGASTELTISMKSVGETMAIGRTFKEALQKGIRSLETGLAGLVDLKNEPTEQQIREKLRVPNPDRLLYLKKAMKSGYDIEELYEVTKIDRWFLHNIKEIIDFEDKFKRVAAKAKKNHGGLDPKLVREAKEMGFSDKQLCAELGMDEPSFRKMRKDMGVKTTFKLVDTCGAEFEAYTPYFYSTYEQEDEGRG